MPAYPTVTGTNTICSGQSTTLTAAGGTSIYGAPPPDRCHHGKSLPPQLTQ